MNLRNLPRYASACVRAVLTTKPRFYLKLLSKSPYAIKNLSSYGVSMIVDVRDPAISKPILALGEYEPSFTKVFLKLARESSQFLDVGANIGFFTLLAASAMPGGRILSIEPDPNNVLILRANIALNGFDESVKVFHAAASESNGEVFFSSLGHDANIGSRFTAKDAETLLARSLPGAAAPSVIESVAVDSLVADQKLDLVKIDVEGHEPSVFKGMQRILSQDRPVILSEFAPGTIEHISKVSPVDYLNSIAAYDYLFAIIENNSSITDLGGSVSDVLARYADSGEHHIDLALVPEEKADHTFAVLDTDIV